MKTLQQQETQAILTLGRRIEELEKLLQEAYDRIRYLESQTYGGPTK